KGHERNPEPAGGIFHFIAHDQYAGADQDKGKQGSDAGHFAHHATGDKSGEHTDEQHKQQVGFIGGAVGFVHIRKHFGQEAVDTHGIEHPALPEQHHQNDGGISQQNRDDNGGIQPRIIGMRDAVYDRPH